MKIPALKVKQWMVPEWDGASFTSGPPRQKPEPHFYVFSASAYLLKRLTGVYRRDPDKPPAEDLGIQRKHRADRSQEILRYMQHGFPLSRIDPKKLVDPAEKNSLQMPGWLPTAVVINILGPADERGTKAYKVKSDELVRVTSSPDDASALIEVPDACLNGTWSPIIHPIEVIDGQHRLWALEEPADNRGPAWSDEFRERINKIEIPVVAFHGLDITWQAYLFYTINQLSKKIDTSMVFDLYPLLRTQEWLLRFEGPNVYRETRAQDLTIILWSQEESPWKDRIIRLGGREKGKVTQAAFLRSLMASFIKRWKTGEGRLGGLFGSPLGSHATTLDWGREQQAAFLIFAWQKLRQAVESSSEEWTHSILDPLKNNKHLLFSGPDTLIATDQGVRGFLCVLNDLLVADFDDAPLELGAWNWEPKADETEVNAISRALSCIETDMPKTCKRVSQIADALGSFDWRVSSILSPNSAQYAVQASYRGSSGYREIRRKMLSHIRSVCPELSPQIAIVMTALNYEVEEEE